MTAKIKIEKEVNLKTIGVSAKVRYWEDSTVNDVEDVNGDLIPCRQGDNWCPRIDVDSGFIKNWKEGATADIHYKVCDCCELIVEDENGDVVKEYDGYVPEVLCPEENGWGDYIIMKVKSDGYISNWNPKALLEIFGDD